MDNFGADQGRAAADEESPPGTESSLERGQGRTAMKR